MIRPMRPKLHPFFIHTTDLGNRWRDAEVFDDVALLSFSFDEVCRCRALWLCHFCSSRLESITIVLVQSDMSVVFFSSVLHHVFFPATCED